LSWIAALTFARLVNRCRLDDPNPDFISCSYAAADPGDKLLGGDHPADAKADLIVPVAHHMINHGVQDAIVANSSNTKLLPQTHACGS